MDPGSIAMGGQCVADGGFSAAIGVGCTATGMESVAMGSYSETSNGARGSAAIGRGCLTEKEGEFSCGKFNIPGNYFNVGCGSIDKASNITRKNAFSINLNSLGETTIGLFCQQEKLKGVERLQYLKILLYPTMKQLKLSI